MSTEPPLTIEELQLATRNHGMPLEALRYDVTPAGLHYLLIHFDIPAVDTANWSLEIDGTVKHPVSFGLEELRAMATTTFPVTLECAGNGRARLDPRPVSQPWILEAVGNAEWTGVPLRDILQQAGTTSDTVEVVFTGMDRGIDGDEEQWYQRSLALDEALSGDVIVATAMNGRPLPPQHGYPARLVVPGWYGMAHVKWLRRITAVAEPFTGHQQAHAYRMRTSEDEPGEPVTRILPRSLMIPPGIPDFMTRDRLVDAGHVELSGRAWSGFGTITSVEVSTDGGASWSPAHLGPTAGSHGWRAWTFAWEAEPGPAVLCSRATDATGRSQGDEPEWNVGGYQVNTVQRIRADVRDR